MSGETQNNEGAVGFQSAIESPVRIGRRGLLKLVLGTGAGLLAGAAGAIGLAKVNQWGIDQAKSRPQGSSVQSPPKVPPLPTHEPGH